MDNGERIIFPAEILIPNVEDFSAWACIACDQFTSEKEYWEKLKSLVGDKPSALNLILPEAYLNSDPERRIKDIRYKMDEYIRDGVFRKLPKGYVLTVRQTPFVKRRIGLVAAVDLEKYDYKKGKSLPIRATEGTIEERIPPRLKVRSGAPIELPHVMILFDDEKKQITEKLYSEREKYEKLYDFELNMGGGRLEGYFIPEDDSTVSKLNDLASAEISKSKYGTDSPFVLAVGDGNHSLATAKAYWEKVKEGLKGQESASNNARYALCELLNVYDEGIYFLPIYRFVKGVNVEDFIQSLAKNCSGNYAYYVGGRKNTVTGKESFSETIINVDAFIAEYISKYGGSVDYVHGEENVVGLVDGDATSLGIFPQTLQKSELFKTIALNGALPRKAFSMGEALEKRYYMEAKTIK